MRVFHLLIVIMPLTGFAQDCDPDFSSSGSDWVLGFNQTIFRALGDTQATVVFENTGSEPITDVRVTVFNTSTGEFELDLDVPIAGGSLPPGGIVVLNGIFDISTASVTVDYDFRAEPINDVECELEDNEVTLNWDDEIRGLRDNSGSFEDEDAGMIIDPPSEIFLTNFGLIQAVPL